jgi:hypothetical protein
MTKQSGGKFKGRRHQRSKKLQMGGFLGGLLGGGGGGGKASNTTTNNTGSNVNLTNDHGRRNYRHRNQTRNYYGDPYGDYESPPPPPRKKQKTTSYKKQQGGFLGKLLGLGGNKKANRTNTRNSGSNVYITNDRGRRNYYNDYDDDEDDYRKRYRRRRRSRRQKQKGI